MSRPLSERMVEVLRATAAEQVYRDGRHCRYTTHIRGQRGTYTAQARALHRRWLIRLGGDLYDPQRPWLITDAGRAVLADIDAATPHSAPRSAPYTPTDLDDEVPVDTIDTTGGVL